jgi:putative membrane protein
MMDNINGWSWVWMSLMMVLFWGGLIFFGVWAIRSFTDRGRSSLDIAKDRYARGDISRDQFEQIRQDLTKTA